MTEAEEIAILKGPLALGKRAARPSPETIRIECLKVAAELRISQQPIKSLIAQARELEEYVTGPSCAPGGASEGLAE